MSIDNVNWKQNTNNINNKTVIKEDNIESKKETKEEPSFFDFILDTINPLQHIPFINTAYREITGDEMTGGSRVFGGLLFGGPIGAAIGLVSSVFEEATGKAPDKMLVDAIFDENSTEDAEKNIVVQNNDDIQKNKNDELNQAILNRHINKTYGEGIDINPTQVALNTNENIKAFEIDRGINAVEIAENNQIIQEQKNTTYKELLQETEETPDEMINRIMIENKIKETYK